MPVHHQTVDDHQNALFSSDRRYIHIYTYGYETARERESTYTTSYGGAATSGLDGMETAAKITALMKKPEFTGELEGCPSRCDSEATRA